MKVYRGSAAAARNYVEADRSRADDYYLAEGTGLAQRYVASPEAVESVGSLAGDAYEAWVAGYDPVTLAAKGRLRTDEQGVRFVEVVVNGPKSWSLAAALDPEVGAAYDAAQDRAARQVIGWLAGHATTRVGPRGRQVQVPVQALEAVTVRHYTSRAGDPHRHLHLQVNARVFAEGRWRGLHTVGMRDSLAAINGIGHAAVLTDPQFRTALAAAGYSVDAESGEIEQLAGFVGPFSARAAQITRNADRYEAEWRTTHPDSEPGPVLRRSWDTRAWAEARPDKVVPRDGAELAARWVEQLYELGYRHPHPDPDQSQVARSEVGVRTGTIDRDDAVTAVLTRLGARRSGWNAADVRGEVELLIARTGVIAEPAARLELAEDLTARTLNACVPLLTRAGVPEHIRALTSQQVLDVEADLTTRLIARADTSVDTVTTPRRPLALAVDPTTVTCPPHQEGSAAVPDTRVLDPAQRAVVDALAGGGSLVVVEGAAGAGKTTTLAAAHRAIADTGHRMLVVTPTLKAASVAARETGAHAASTAWLAHQHGYRWDDTGAWTRLRPGDVDPVTLTSYNGPSAAAVLHSGDVLVVDEAGMLNQDTARALLVIADHAGARVALVGDRHQLPAVGRGGVLDLAARWTHPDAHLTLEGVQRFSDLAYGDLTLAMRTGRNSGEVFDALLARGQIVLHRSDAERNHLLADAGGQPHGEPAGAALSREGRVVVVADTHDQVAALNAGIRDRLVTAGRVDDRRTVTTAAGERIGVGDRVATRRNDRDLDVANRETWTVTAIRDGNSTVGAGACPAGGGVTVTGRGGRRELPAGYVREHVSLAYASTVYGAQGETVDAAHLLVGEHTGAASAYVAMTRGRHTNTAHLVAQDVEEARGRWVEVFTRDRADLGPAHAAQLAGEQADRYAPNRPLDLVLQALHRAWDTEHDLTGALQGLTHRHTQLTGVVAARAENQAQLTPYWQVVLDAERADQQARARVDAAETAVTADADRLTDTLQQQWHAEQPAVRRAAETVQAGTGLLGHRRGQVNRATDHLHEWAERWRPVLPDLPPDPSSRAADLVAYLAWGQGARQDAFAAHARRQAEHAHPERRFLDAAARTAAHDLAQVEGTYRHAATAARDRLAGYGTSASLRDPEQVLADTDQRISELAGQLQQTRDRITALHAEPALRNLPPGRLALEHNSWLDQGQDVDESQQTDAARSSARRRLSAQQHAAERHPQTFSPDRPSHGMSR